jgi:hypothetical protein
MTRKTSTWVVMAFAGLATATLLQAQNTPAQSATPVSPPGSAVAPPGTNPNVTIAFSTFPSVTASVTWGRKPLGIIPREQYLVIVRPRDSGPIDVMIRAKGYLPVQTRAYTFSDQNIKVKLTPIDNKNDLLGYRVPLDAGTVQPTDSGPNTTQNIPPAADASLPPKTEPLKPASKPPAPNPPPSQPEQTPWYKFW